MSYSVGVVPVDVIIVIMIVIDDHSRVVISIAPMVIVCMMAPIDADRHDGKWIKVWRIVSVVVWRIIGHIDRGIYILHDRCWLNNYCCCCGRYIFSHGVISFVRRISSDTRGRSLRFDDIVFAIQILVTNNLHCYLFILILWNQYDGYILCFFFTDSYLEYKGEIITFLGSDDLDKINFAIQVQIQIIDSSLFEIQFFFKIFNSLWFLEKVQDSIQVQIVAWQAKTFYFCIWLSEHRDAEHARREHQYC